MNNLEFEYLYSDTEFDDHSSDTVQSGQLSHKENFIKNILDIYLQIKSTAFGKKTTDEVRGEYKRHKNRKQTHFAGQ